MVLLCFNDVTNTGGDNYVYTATEKTDVFVSALVKSTTEPNGNTVAYTILNKNGTVTYLTNGSILSLDVGDKVGFHTTSTNNIPYSNVVVFTVVGLK